MMTEIRLGRVTETAAGRALPRPWALAAVSATRSKAVNPAGWWWGFEQDHDQKTPNHDTVVAKELNMAQLTATANASRHWLGKAGGYRMTAAASSVAVLLWLSFGLRLILLPLLPWAVGLVLLAVSDLQHHLLSKRLAYLTAGVTGVTLSIVAVVSDDWGRFGLALISAVIGAGIYGVIWLVLPQSLGFGDVRLAGLVSLMLGWFNPLLAIFGLAAGQVACLIALGVLACTGRVKRNTEMPLGTFLAITSIGFVVVFGR
jgi:leader peptidase (prepilin peptidase)/N-methyltransferase